MRLSYYGLLRVCFVLAIKSAEVRIKSVCIASIVVETRGLKYHE